MCIRDSTIIAHPSTITGSIGVISMAFNLSDMYEKIGINKEIIKRGDFSDLNTQTRQWTDKERQKYLNVALPNVIVLKF